MTPNHDHGRSVTTGTAAPADAFGLWEATVSEALLPCGAAPATPSQHSALFTGRATGHLDTAELRLVSFASDPVSTWRTHRHIDATATEMIVAVMLIEGSAVLHRGDERITVGRGDIVLIDSLHPARLDAMTPHRALTATVPRQWAADRLDLAEDALRIPRIASGSVARLTTTYLDGLAALPAEDIAGTLTSTGTELILETMAHTLGRDTADRHGPDALRERVRAFVRRHSGDPDLTVEDIARGCMLSRRTLYRVTERLGGPAELLRTVRIDNARRLLVAHPGREVATIARWCGFRTDRHFYRAFRAATGVTPQEYRQRALGG
ncbi:helix-turn-helix domain-containing protein [Nocardia thailandica]